MVIVLKKIFRFVRWQLAKVWLKLWPDVDVIGIAGSVGKTTVKELIAGVLGTKFKVVRTLENWDPIFNIPITSFSVNGNSKFIAELSVDVPGQMDKYFDLIHPRIGVLTRLSLEHSDKEHFGTKQIAVEEEVKLIRNLPSYGWAILNGDDPCIVESSKFTSAHVLFCGFDSNNDLRITKFSQKITNLKVKSTVGIKYDSGYKEFETSLLGKQNAILTTIAVAAGTLYGMTFEDIQNGLKNIRPVPGRLEPKLGKWGIVVDDSYNASPAAVESAIDVLVDLDPQSGILILGDMLELGEYSREAHYNIGKYAKDRGVSRIAVIGDYAKDFERGYGLGVFIAEEHDQIVNWVSKIGKGTVLVKGSHGMQMVKVVNALTR